MSVKRGYLQIKRKLKKTNCNENFAHRPRLIVVTLKLENNLHFICPGSNMISIAI